jgi:hypothetical protein
MKPSVLEKEVSIPVGKTERTSGLLSVPTARPERRAVILAHGAGNNMTNPLLSAFATGLAAAGCPTLRFNFLYAHQKKKSPDSRAALVKTWQAAHRFLLEESRLELDSVVAAGKSMGGRVASQMQADGLLPVQGLIFLGYPLHPAGNPEKLRDSHLYQIKVPMLFFAGTRDPLCDLKKLKGVLPMLNAPWDLRTVNGGDHSFNVPKSLGINQQDIFRQIVEKAVEWLARSVS